MQNFTQYNYKLTVADLLRIAAETPEIITVIINGEYYDITPENSEK